MKRVLMSSFHADNLYPTLYIELDCTKHNQLYKFSISKIASIRTLFSAYYLHSALTISVLLVIIL